MENEELMVVEEEEIKLCDYGCGQEATHQFKNGAKCCESHSSRCIALKKKFVPKKGRFSEATIEKIKATSIKQWANADTRVVIETAIKSDKNRKKISITQKRLCKAPEEIKRRSEQTKKSWADDVQRENRIVAIRESWKNENLRLHMSKGQKKLCEDPEEIKRRSERMLKIWRTPEYREKRLKIIQSQEMRERISLAVTKLHLEGVYDNPTYSNGYFLSKKNNKKLWYRSSYELQAYNMLDQMSVVKSYEVEPFRISYQYDGITKNTIPDILVTYNTGIKELIEVKPIFMLKDKQTQCKLLAMDSYCNDNNINFSVWTEEHLFGE